VQMKKFIKGLRTPIAIVGMGKSGEAAKRLLLLAGFSENDLVTFDGKLSTAHFSDPHKMMQEARPKTLVVSPGVPLVSPWLMEARNEGVTITSEISLACDCLENEKIMGVTGSVGKSTTVSILGAGLEAFSKTGFVGGNLGTPVSEYAADILAGKKSRADWLVLELSSYQLENCAGLELDFSAITYLTANHLERYESLEQYYATKWAMLMITKGKMFLNASGGDLVNYSKNAPKNDKAVIVSYNDPILQSLDLAKAQLIGVHNQDNLALAASMALAAGWPPSAIEGMKSFKGLDHRLENVGEFKGIRFINDSKATALDSVSIAVHAAAGSRQKEGTLYVLLGGKDKSLPWEVLSDLEKIPQTSFLFFGQCRDIAQTKSKLKGPSFAQLNEALDAVFSKAQKGDTVLLSPGGTSLDEFKNFEDRGHFFKKKVAEFFRS